MMKTIRETTSMVALGSASQEREAVKAAFQEVQSSFENFCLLAGIEAFQDLLEERPPICVANATSAMRTGKVAAGERPGARWPFMAVGSTSNGRGFGRLTANRNWNFPALPPASARTGWAAGR